MMQVLSEKEFQYKYLWDVIIGVKGVLKTKPVKAAKRRWYWKF